ncbi:TonB-dependent receptor [Agriterribacter sp.]|uniref:SusC/RagA family TonB-linked outer membrane protein n=1 Tax=Agriterribacter sp. TaxID=2821509 RepID=UPI002D805361|nr:TonB-dependent receptor [Agriterribacter sp.]
MLALKKKRIVSVLIFFLIIWLSIPIVSIGKTIPSPDQQTDIFANGKVLGENGEPLSGVTILEKGSAIGSTLTDETGVFSIKVSSGNSIIVLSYIGYKTIEMPASKINGAAISMTRDKLNLDEVVVTGYVSQKKADLTGAVSVVNVSQIATNPTGSAMRALQGKVAGMSVSANGSPDPNATVRIRGEGTLNNNNPLYIIDGTPTTRSMGELAMMDIESIQVLKDASSASIYGSRAANGVIIISTRKGKKGTVVNFNASYTSVSSRKPLNLMNTEQRGIAQYWAIKNDNPNADPNVVGIGGLYNYVDHQDANGNFVLDKVTWREYLDPVQQTMKSADTDWQKEILRRGQIQQYNVSLSSGGDNSHVFFDLDYYDNKGTIKGSYFNRYSARINSDYSFLNKRVKIGENLSISKWRRSTHIGESNIGSTKSLMSIVPVHTVDGVGWGGPIGGMSDRHNPVRLIEDNLQNYQDVVRLFGNAYANVEIAKGLSFQSSFGLDLAGTWQKTMDLTYSAGFLSEDRSKVTQSSNYQLNWNNSNVLRYVFDVGRHNVDVMGGQESIGSQSNNFWASRRVYALETPNYMQLDRGETERDNGGNESINRMSSWFGKINYNFDSRYLASFTLRKDASSIFGASNRWATFPAFSLGWVLSNEKFMQGLAPTLSHLKLRYGWGQNGNSQIDNYAAFQMYEFLYDVNTVWDWNWGTAYDFTGQAGNLPSGFRRTQRGNPGLKWETTEQHNVGVDFSLLNSTLSGSVDYYLKSTRDILMKPGTVATLGEGAGMWLNGANIRNRGFEVTLNYTNNIGKVATNVGVVLAHNKQKIVKVPDVVINNFAGNGKDDNILGRSRSSMYGYIADGLFRSQDEVDNAPAQVGAAPGRIKYRDINGPDGKPDGKIDNHDRTWIGVQDPTLEYGFNAGARWKNFDFNIFFNGILGKNLNVQGWKTWTIYALGTVGENYDTKLLDAWTPTNTGSNIPAISVNNYNEENRFSTYYVENGSYLKIRNVELGYSFSRKLLSAIKSNQFRAYLRCDNVLTVSKNWGKNAYTGLDPETPGTSYPLPFSITTGIKLTF